MEKVFKVLNSIPNDKLLHNTYGTLIFLALSVFMSNIYALGIVVLIAGSKEVYDYKNKDKHTPDIWDFFATIFFSSLFAIKDWYLTLN